MRIRTQLLLLAVMILLPALIAGWVALEKIRDSERETALRGLRETVRATVLIVDREAQASLSAMRALGNSAYLHAGDYESFYAQAAEFNQMPDAWMLLLDADGTQILNTVVPYGTKLRPVVALDLVKKVIATQKPLVSDLVQGSVTGKKITAIFAPTLAGSGKKYVLAQAFSEDFWKKKAFAAILPSDWLVGVIDRNGKFIARSQNSNAMLGKPARPELVRAAALRTEGLIRHQTLENVDAYDAFAHSELTGWTIAVAAPVQTMEAAGRRAINVALMGMVIAVLFAIVAVMAFGTNLIWAIERVRRSARMLGSGQKPPPISTTLKEITELNSEMVDAGALLQTERSFRLAAEAQRENLLVNEKAAREDAQSQNKAKDEFLAMLGHELRNPLAAISGATALLGRPALDQDRLKRCIDVIGRQNGHLSRIVDDLLDVSRLLAGKIDLETQPLNLQDSIDKCVDALKASGRLEHVDISINANSAWILGDPVRIEQVLNNLITNAIKFSPTGAKVVISAGLERNQAMVSVQDRGIGLSEDLFSKIFEPFVQGPPAADRTQAGLGIGLALVKQILDLHHGTVTASSAGPNMGSLFVFRIPSIPAPQSQAQTEHAPARAKRKVVLVEDNEDARVSMSELLRTYGYEVFEAINGSTALEIIRAVQPEIVLLDIGLPDMSGYEVAQRLRNDPTVAAIPLIALTGYGLQSDKATTRVAGFAGHLSKPAKAAEIQRTIESILSKHVEL